MLKLYGVSNDLELGGDTLFSVTHQLKKKKTGTGTGKPLWAQRQGRLTLDGFGKVDSITYLGGCEKTLQTKRLGNIWKLYETPERWLNLECT